MIIDPTAEIFLVLKPNCKLLLYSSQYPVKNTRSAIFTDPKECVMAHSSVSNAEQTPIRTSESATVRRYGIVSQMISKPNIY